MHVGWIGLGRVGMQMALVTLAAGHEVTGHSRSFDRHAEVEAAGGKLCASATETVRDADIVCVNVFSEQQLARRPASPPEIDLPTWQGCGRHRHS